MQTIENHKRILIDAMCTIIGCKEDELMKCRRRPYPFSRGLIFRKLYNYGYTFAEIASATKVTRTTIAYLVGTTSNTQMDLYKAIEEEFNKVELC